MNKPLAHNPKALRLPQLAAMMLFFLGLSTNTHLDAATAWAAPTTVATSIHITPANDSLSLPTEGGLIHVLSARDAALYRSAFAAQDKADWKSADDALEQIKDKRLVGHVLADRYLRRDLSLGEAQQWLAAYAELPEAAAIYERARHNKGFANAHLPRPIVVATWTGNSGLDTASGFRSAVDGDASTSKNHITSKINVSLRHGDPMAARELLTTEMQRGTISIDEAGDIVSRIAATFFYQGQSERARAMAHGATPLGTPLALWIDGLSAWKLQDFSAAAKSFAALAQNKNLSAWDHASAAYWAYRAAKRTGDEAQAYRWLNEAAKEPRTFYGYMAASLSGHAPARSWKMPELNAKNTAFLAGRASGWQALALTQIGKIDLAEIELRRLPPVRSRDIQSAALALAEQAHMPALTLELGGVVTNDNGQSYEAAQYPLPAWQPTGGFKVDRALLYALMKHESHFDPTAVSQSGACGLMQIMPSTAREIANDNYSGRHCADALLDPATNMDVGQKYVRVLAGQPMIGDNLMLLLAAYNGGPGNLAHWLEGGEHADPLLFMESLPVRETRDYTQQVLLQYWMYRARLSEPETSVAQLAHGQWPRYALRDEGLAQAANQNLEVASVEQRQINGR